jgi:hypothetical protein
LLMFTSFSEVVFWLEGDRVFLSTALAFEEKQSAKQKVAEIPITKITKSFLNIF